MADIIRGGDHTPRGCVEEVSKRAPFCSQATSLRPEADALRLVAIGTGERTAAGDDLEVGHHACLSAVLRDDAVLEVRCRALRQHAVPLCRRDRAVLDTK